MPVFSVCIACITGEFSAREDRGGRRRGAVWATLHNMPKAYKSWTVHAHGPLEQLADNLWSVEAKLQGMSLKRRMVVVRIRDELLIHNAIALNDETMPQLDALGNVRWLVVPNGWHRLDCAVFRKRYPDAQVLCPHGSRRKVAAVVDIDGTYDAFPKHDEVELRHLEGMRQVEGVLCVHSEDGATLVFNDLIFNVPRQEGGLVMRLLGSSGGPKVTRIMRIVAVKNRKALRAQLERLDAEFSPVRVIPGHGHVMTAPSVLRDIAASL